MDCACIEKLMIIGRVKNFSSDTDRLCDYAVDVEEGDLCLVFDTIVDNGDFNEEGIWCPNFENTKVLYPIEYCPVCGKKVKREKVDPMQLRLEI